jgi:hypothetical protein
MHETCDGNPRVLDVEATIRDAGMTKFVRLILLLAAPMTGGCVEISYWLTGNLPGNPDGGSGGNGNGNIMDNGNTAARFAVRLTASNITPVVSEEVVLNCAVEAGSSAGATFSYEPMSTRLIVDTMTGRATLIVSEPDVGVAFMVRCFAENALGDTAASNTLTIIASRPPA